MVTGAIAEQVKKTDIAMRPGIRDTVDMLRPKAKARNRKAGNMIPIRTTGPFE
jgi:hypothetical protein